MGQITSRERTAILQSLAAGVVPAIGLQHIQVGRLDEVAALLGDLQWVAQGASSIRLVIGRYGSGKTFFLNLIRHVAVRQKFVVAQADITTERRLQGTAGQARGLYRELMRNLSTPARLGGGALQNLLNRWVGDVDHDVRSGGGSDEDVKCHLAKALLPLLDLVGGFDFLTVLTRYYEGHLDHNGPLQASALRWLRAEYASKMDARRDLAVRTIIDDASWYDDLKLFAKFLRIAGYAGLLVNIDELVVLSHRLSNTTARNKNYEALLRILNDCLQGHTEGLAFVFAGTDECLEDRRRGLYSYEALARRLAPGHFGSDTSRDLSLPVIQLPNLSPEDCFVLLSNIRRVQAGGDESKLLLPDEALVAYLQDCHRRLGASFFQTPAETVKGFVGLLHRQEQHPCGDWRALLARADESSRDSAAACHGRASDLSEFRL